MQERASLLRDTYIACTKTLLSVRAGPVYLPDVTQTIRTATIFVTADLQFLGIFCSTVLTNFTRLVLTVHYLLPQKSSNFADRHVLILRISLKKTTA